ncbi:MAG TPA: response regulator, partial [Armatimonadetes bacterium]|nr:response regulator [Armatimonadota bacterium]
GRKPYIAVIDDEESVRHVCQIALQRKGYNVATFADAQSAIHAAQHESFDIALVDWLLPDLDGFSLFQRLKEHLPRIAGIVITGQNTRDAALKALGAGLLWVLTKPFNITELIAVIEAARQYCEVVHQSEQLQVQASLVQAAESLLRQLELDELAHQLVSLAKWHASADAASVLVMDPQRGCLRVVAASGVSVPADAVEVQPDKGIDGLVVQRRQPIIINREVANDPSIAKHLRYGGRGTALCLPLLDDEEDERVHGVLNITRWSDEPQFTQSDAEALNWLRLQAGIAIARAQEHRQVKESFFGVTRQLVALWEAQDPYRFGHSEQVTKYACALAQAIGCKHNEVEAIRTAALLHELGLYQIDKRILHKPAQLNDQEYAQIKRYPELTLRVLNQVPFVWDVRPAILHHREHYDGSGYPRGLSGEQIPLSSRILAVADTYVALISKRPHRDPFPVERAQQLLREMAGSQLDPKLVSVFLDKVVGGSEHAPHAFTVSPP